MTSAQERARGAVIASHFTRGGDSDAQGDSERELPDSQSLRGLVQNVVRAELELAFPGHQAPSPEQQRRSVARLKDEIRAEVRAEMVGCVLAALTLSSEMLAECKRLCASQEQLRREVAQLRETVVMLQGSGSHSDRSPPRHPLAISGGRQPNSAEEFGRSAAQIAQAIDALRGIANQGTPRAQQQQQPQARPSSRPPNEPQVRVYFESSSSSSGSSAEEEDGNGRLRPHRNAGPRRAVVVAPPAVGSDSDPRAAGVEDEDDEDDDDGTPTPFEGDSEGLVNIDEACSTSRFPVTTVVGKDGRPMRVVHFAPSSASESDR